MFPFVTQVFATFWNSLQTTTYDSIGKNSALLPLDFWSASREIILPEVVLRIVDELDESDEQAPGMRAQCYESFEENSSDLEIAKCEFERREIFKPAP